MPVIQVALYISDDIYNGLLTGIYRRDGGVIRHTQGSKKGKIKALLSDNNVPYYPSKQFSSITQPSKNYNPATQRSYNDTFVQADNTKNGFGTGVLVGTVITGAAIGLGSAYFKSRQERKRKEFLNALRQYLDALRFGKLTTSIIDNMSNALCSTKLDSLDCYMLTELVKISIKYTELLETNNAMPITVNYTLTFPINDFKDNLSDQRRILLAA